MAPVCRRTEFASAAALSVGASAPFAHDLSQDVMLSTSSAILLGAATAAPVITPAVTSTAPLQGLESDLISPNLSAADISLLREYIFEKLLCPAGAVKLPGTAEPVGCVCKGTKPFRPRSSARRPSAQPRLAGRRRANMATRAKRVEETKEAQGRLRSGLRKWHSPTHTSNNTNSAGRHKPKPNLGGRQMALQSSSGSRRSLDRPSMRDRFSKRPHHATRRQLSATDVTSHYQVVSSTRVSSGRSCLPRRSSSCCHCCGDADSCYSHKTPPHAPSPACKESAKPIHPNISSSNSIHSNLGRKSSLGSTDSLHSRPRGNSCSASSTGHLSDMLSAQDSKEAFIMQFALLSISHTQKLLQRERARKRVPSPPASNTPTTGPSEIPRPVGVAEAPVMGSKPKTDISDDERRTTADGRTQQIIKRNKLRSLPEPENLLEVKHSEDVESWLKRLSSAHDCHDSSKNSYATDECQAYARLLSPRQRSAGAPVKTYPCAWQREDGRCGGHKECRRWRRTPPAPRHWQHTQLAHSRVRGNAGTRVQRLRDRYTSYTLKTCMDALARVLKQPSERVKETKKRQQIALVSGPSGEDEGCVFVVESALAAESTRNLGDSRASDGRDVKLSLATLLSGPIPEGETHTEVIKPSDRLENILQPMVSVPGDPFKTEGMDFEVMMTSYGGSDLDLKSISSREIINTNLPITRNANTTNVPNYDIQSAQTTEFIQNNNMRSGSGKIQTRKHQLINVEKNYLTIPEKRKSTIKQPLAKNIAETQKRQPMTKCMIISYPLPDLSQCRPKVDTGLRRPQNVSTNDLRKKYVTKAETKNSTPFSDKNTLRSKFDGKNKQTTFPVYRFDKAKKLISPSSSDHALPSEVKSKSYMAVQRESFLFSRYPLPQILEASDNEDGSEEHGFMYLKAGTKMCIEVDQYDKYTSSLQSSESLEFGTSESDDSNTERQAEDHHSSEEENAARYQRIQATKLKEEATEVVKIINIRIPLTPDDPPECVASEDDASMIESTKSSTANASEQSFEFECNDLMSANEHLNKSSSLTTSSKNAISSITNETTNILKVEEANVLIEELSGQAEDSPSAISEEDNQEESSLAQSFSAQSDYKSISHNIEDFSFSSNSISEKSSKDIPASIFATGESTKLKTANTVNKDVRFPTTNASICHLLCTDSKNIPSQDDNYEQKRSTMREKGAGDQTNMSFISANKESLEGEVSENVFMENKTRRTLQRVTASQNSSNKGQSVSNKTSSIVNISMKGISFGKQFIQQSPSLSNACNVYSSNPGEWIKTFAKNLGILSRFTTARGKKTLVINPYSVDPPIRLRGAGSGGVNIDRTLSNSLQLVLNGPSFLNHLQQEKEQIYAIDYYLSRIMYIPLNITQEVGKQKNHNTSRSHRSSKFPSISEHDTTNFPNPETKILRRKTNKLRESILPNCMKSTNNLSLSFTNNTSHVEVIRPNLKDPESVYSEHQNNMVTTKSSLQYGICSENIPKNVLEESNDEVKCCTMPSHTLRKKDLPPRVPELLETE